MQGGGHEDVLSLQVSDNAADQVKLGIPQRFQIMWQAEQFCHIR